MEQKEKEKGKTSTEPHAVLLFLLLFITIIINNIIIITTMCTEVGFLFFRRVELCHVVNVFFFIIRNIFLPFLVYTSRGWGPF